MPWNRRPAQTRRKGWRLHLPTWSEVARDREGSSEELRRDLRKTFAVDANESMMCHGGIAHQIRTNHTTPSHRQWTRPSIQVKQLIQHANAVPWRQCALRTRSVNAFFAAPGPHLDKTACPPGPNSAIVGPFHAPCGPSGHFPSMPGAACVWRAVIAILSDRGVAAGAQRREPRKSNEQQNTDM